MFDKFVENPDYTQGLEATLIYPHSVTISELTKAKPEFDKFFSESLFMVYFGIYSKVSDRDFIVDSAIIDITSNTENSYRSRKFEKLDCKEFRDYMTSIQIIFPPFKRNLLNFEKRAYSISEYMDTVKLWLDL